MDNILRLEEGMYYFDCPNCGFMVQVSPNELNCRIFRHATYKINGEQIHPHMPKEMIDRLIANNQIYGCGKPFQIVGDRVIVCDYI